jgi:hypothetical protein
MCLVSYQTKNQPKESTFQGERMVSLAEIQKHKDCVARLKKACLSLEDALMDERVRKGLGGKVLLKSIKSVKSIKSQAKSIQSQGC